MTKILKELHGFSNNKIFLISEDEKLLVRKIGNVSRNIERMFALSDFPIPKIFYYNDDRIDMEYIHGLDMKTYLTTNAYNPLLNFIVSILDRFKNNTIEKDYTNYYIDKLSQIELDRDIIFTKEQLIEKLPRYLPSSQYHGDLTLENILYSINNKSFYFIDPLTSEFDSYVFDIAKLRQDLQCGWFIRNDHAMIDVKIKHIQQELLSLYPEADNDYLLILMLLRVYRYSTPNSSERKFLTNGINSLWK